MRLIKSFAFTIVAASALLLACSKVADLPSYANGTATVLSSSTVTVAPPPADSNKVALTLTWTNPKYAIDSSNYKFVIEMDSAGKNFANPLTKTVMKARSADFTAKEINSFLVGRNYAFNVPVDMDVRVTSSYANNNERLFSNTLRIKVTPYKVPPKVALPSSLKLFLVGDATAGGWNNPVPVPTQEFSRLDETTWAGIFSLTSGKEYLVLPVNGDWSHKFAVANKSLLGLATGGDFGFDLGDNFPAPATSGTYKIVIDFQQGKFTVTPYTSVLPTNLFIVGDATPGGWNNPVPVPTQQFTRINSSEWKVTLNMTGAKEYLLLPVNGDWSHKYAVSNKTIPGLSAGGDFGYDLPDNFPAPAASGTKTISVNFAAKPSAANQAGTFTVQ